MRRFHIFSTRVRFRLCAAACLLAAPGLRAAPTHRVHAAVHPAHSAAGEHGQGYLGIEFHDLLPERSAHAGPGNVEITAVDHDGPAGKAGLLPHDIVSGIDGHGISRAEDLRQRIREYGPGKLITLSIIRMGQVLSLTARLANREELEHRAWLAPGTLPQPLPNDPAELPGSAYTYAAEPPATPPAGSQSLTSRSEAFLGNVLHMTPYTGAALEQPSAQLAQFFGAPPRTGMLVQSVETGSPAALGGMRAGDIVLRVNGSAVRSASDWMKQIRAGKGSVLRVVVLRDRREQTLLLDLAARHHSMLLWPTRR